jgi:hypothetical protein
MKSSLDAAGHKSHTKSMYCFKSGDKRHGRVSQAIPSAVGLTSASLHWPY